LKLTDEKSLVQQRPSNTVLATMTRWTI